ncbi:MAG: SH3 domain-containing protein, partial [Kofleriaceae bacterium]
MTLRLAVAAASLFFLCALLGGVAHADRVRTTKTTKVFKRTGEQSGVVTKVAKGKTLQVVAKQGRWLKVRVNGRTGWVTQSSV